LDVCVEFTGIARSIIGSQSLVFSLPDRATCAEMVVLLAQNFPGLRGLIINPEGTGLLNSNVFFINGETMIMPDRMDQVLCEGDRLTLLSVIVGG
jgi:hypothetical protein